MRIVLFCHSLISDWNHGNAHFLRGICSELIACGHDLRVYEPADAWSVENLVAQHGQSPIAGFAHAYPRLTSTRYRLDALDLDRVLDGADLVLVHEWNDHGLVRRIGQARRTRPAMRVLFHDTHHRSVTDPQAMASYDLRDYDGVLAFGAVIRDLYLREGWAARAWTWHEAADARVFHPLTPHIQRDLVWIGNWGDDERTAELHEFLLEPVRALQLRARVHGVRYPEHARQALAEAGVDYAGWVPNYEAPRVFSQARVTVHVPRRPYVQALPGIPTIRVFEALACGIPLVSAPWDDAEGLFTPGEDFLVARDGADMQRQLQRVLSDRHLAHTIAHHGRQTVLARHTCAHRVAELMAVCAEIAPASASTPASMLSSTAPSPVTPRTAECAPE